MLFPVRCRAVRLNAPPRRRLLGLLLVVPFGFLVRLAFLGAVLLCFEHVRLPSSEGIAVLAPAAVSPISNAPSSVPVLNSWNTSHAVVHPHCWWCLRATRPSRCNLNSQKVLPLVRYPATLGIAAPFGGAPAITGRLLPKPRSSMSCSLVTVPPSSRESSAGRRSGKDVYSAAISPDAICNVISYTGRAAASRRCW